MIHKFQSWIDKKQFCPTIEGIENEDLENLANKLKGDSEKETLTNILEWQDRNIQYWNERGLLEIPLLLLTPIYFILCFLISALIFIGIYFIFLPFLGTALSIKVGLLTFLIFLIWFMLQDTLIKAIYAVLLFYPIYELERLFLMSSPSRTSVIDLGLIVASFNGILFGASVFTLLYIVFSYLPLFRGDSARTKISKLLMIMNDTFKFNLSIEKVLNHRFAICRDYAKLTGSLLFRSYQDTMIYFFTIPGHVAAAVKIKNEYYILDQKLPVLTKDGWLKRWNRKDAIVYASEFVRNSKGESIKVNFNKHEKVPLSDFREDKDIDKIELRDNVSKLLGIKQISQKEKPDFEISLKDYAIYYEVDDIIKYSLMKAIKNKLENEFCGNVDKISKVELNQSENKNDLNLSVYLQQ